MRDDSFNKPMRADMKVVFRTSDVNVCYRMQPTLFLIEGRCSQIAKQPCFPVESQSGDATETVARIQSLCRWGRFSQLCCH